MFPERNQGNRIRTSTGERGRDVLDNVPVCGGFGLFPMAATALVVPHALWARASIGRIL